MHCFQNNLANKVSRFLYHFQELARKLQDQEKERHERKQRERELLRERKRIERDVERTTKQVLAEYQTEASRKHASACCFPFCP